jgi:hypothetical protein
MTAHELSTADGFHAHLDVCGQCRDNPFALCPIGYELLIDAVTSEPVDLELRGLSQWNRALKGNRND